MSGAAKKPVVAAGKTEYIKHHRGFRAGDAFPSPQKDNHAY
jgi:hypothetical protein